MALVTPLSILPTAPSAAAPPPGGSPQPRELRLAVVCDGGVALAIYEHGITKELWHAVVASRAFDALSEQDKAAPPEPLKLGLPGTQAAYFKAFAALHKAGRPVSLVIDVISGTSAGGINGVCLAKGLARNASQDALTTLWMERGDLKVLAPHHSLGSTAIEIAEIVGSLLKNRDRVGWAPLSNEVMSSALLQAMEAIENAAPSDQPGLMPTGHTLDLFVTTTDVAGYNRFVPSPDGGLGEYDRVNRKVFHFTAPADQPHSLGGSDNAGLAFAARCTSSFPGAFPPASLDEFAAIAADQHVPFDVTAFALAQLSEYPLAGLEPATVRFADGGLLDNQPFDHVLAAISSKRAQSQVDRRIVHVDPNESPWPAKPVPGQRLQPGAALPWLQAVVSALRVKAGQSTVTQLLEIQRLNDVINDLGGIASQLENDVLSGLGSITDLDALATGGLDNARTVARTLQEQVLPGKIGSLNLSLYQQLKVSTIADMLADDLSNALGFPPQTQEASFVRRVLCELLTPNGPAGADLATFLNETDMPYRERRLRFVLAGLNLGYDQAAPQSRAALDGLKRSAWDVLEGLLDRRKSAAAAVAETAGLRKAVVDHAYGSPAEFVAANQTTTAALLAAYQNQLAGYGGDAAAPLWEALERLTGGDTGLGAVRGQLVSRYVAFPLWDAAVFPVIALSRLPQLTPIQVTRLSPAGPGLLTPPAQKGKPTGKLLGGGYGHFGGFLDRTWRENDYLWGRLDAVQQILAMLDPAVSTDLAKTGVRAVLTGEQELREVQGLIKDLLAQLDEH